MKRGTASLHISTGSNKSIPHKDPLLTNPRHELHGPFANPPLATGARQLCFARHQHELVDVLAVRRAGLALPLVFAKVHAGEIRCGVGAVAGRGDCDLLGCEGVLRGDVVEAVGEKKRVWLDGWFPLVYVCSEMDKWSVRLSFLLVHDGLLTVSR